MAFKVLSFNSNSILGKLDEIKALVEVYKPDIVAVTETKIDSCFDDNELLGPTYTVVRKDRKRGGGGVLLAAVNSSPHVKLIKSIDGPGESVICTFQAHSHLAFNIIVYYRPPGETTLDDLSELLTCLNPTHPSVLVGDFNLPDIAWSSGKGKVKKASPRHSLHRQALDLFQLSNLQQLVSEPTHMKGNTLDLVLVERCLLDDVNIVLG
jgi:exonuclease III